MEIIVEKNKHDRDMFDLYSTGLKDQLFGFGMIHIDLIGPDLVDRFMELKDGERLELEFKK